MPRRRVLPSLLVPALALLAACGGQETFTRAGERRSWVCWSRARGRGPPSSGPGSWPRREAGSSRWSAPTRERMDAEPPRGGLPPGGHQQDETQLKKKNFKLQRTKILNYN